MDTESNSCYLPRIVGGTCIDISIWPYPDEGALTNDVLNKYVGRKKAVLLYLEGASNDQIKLETDLCAKQVYRLIRERCLQIHEDGQVYGWRGLIPYLHIRAYKRVKKIQVSEFGTGAVGAMEATLDAHPELRASLEKRIKAKHSGNALESIKTSVINHCQWFLDELRRLGYEKRGEWPFNTDSVAYYSIRRYIKKLLLSNPKALAAATGGPELVRKLKTGDGSGRPITKFLQRVEMDAHKIDGHFCVSMFDLDGTIKERIVHRLWVIVIIDIVSRLVLGYYFSLNKEVSADDTLRAIKRALTKWTPRELTFSDIAYAQGAGLLSAKDDKYIGLCWDETSVDGALAETCNRVEKSLRECVGSVLLTPTNSFSVRRSLDDRPFIEVFFKNLAGRGFQRLSNTSGAKASDRKGREPEKIAISSRFQYEYAEEILDVLIANYNAKPHSGIGRRSPLDYAKQLFEQAAIAPRRAELKSIEALLSVRKLCRVRGGAALGRSIYVEFNYARYSNEQLQNRQDLVGQHIWVIHHKEDDARVALSSTQDGMYLGVLRAAPPWHRTPHSLRVRKAICLAESKGKLQISSGGDAIEEFIHYVETQPNKKLPVHPAYLEARRILSTHDQFIGEKMHAEAIRRADLKKTDDGSTPRPDPTSPENDLPNSTGNSTNVRSLVLPPRRLAVFNK